jgi:hypothetical protein
MKRPTDQQMKALDSAISDAIKRRIPSGPTIAAKAVAAGLVGHEENAAWIKRNFSKLVERVQIDAYNLYLAEEGEAGSKALVEAFLPLVPANAKPADVVHLVGSYFPSLDRVFLRLTQSRRPRAGGAFEYLLRELFVKLRYPFTRQPVINGQPDFVMPALEHFRRNPPDCIIFTVKRTLRERWRQIVTEGTRGLGFYLATIDEKVANRDLADMLSSRINLVVPGRVKNCREDYEKAANVITFEQFFKFHLDPAMVRWRAHKVI